MKKRIFCCAFAFLLCGCGMVMKKEEPRPAVVPPESSPEYKVEQVRIADIESSATVYFSYRKSGSREYSFDHEGYIGNVYFKSGDNVFAGDLLATMDGYDAAKTDLDKYLAEKENIEKQIETLSEKLDEEVREYEIKHKYGYMSDEEYTENTQKWHEEYDDRIKELQDDLTILQMRIDRSQQLVDNGALYAEASGIVTMSKTVYTESGRHKNWWEEQDEEDDPSLSFRRFNLVKAGETVITVSDSGSEAFFAETEYADKFIVGDEVILEVGGKSLKTGVTETVDNKVVLTPYYADTAVYSGMQISYQLPLEKKENVKVISNSSIHATDGKYYVYIIGDDGFRQMRWIETGVSDNKDTEVTDGLEIGDIVIKR